MTVREIPETLASVLQRWDDIAQRWRLDEAERAALVGGLDRAPGGGASAFRLICGEQRIRLIVGVEPVLARALLSDSAVRNWLREPDPGFDGLEPLEAMAGSPEVMLWLARNEGASS